MKNNSKNNVVVITVTVVGVGIHPVFEWVECPIP